MIRKKEVPGLIAGGVSVLVFSIVLYGCQQRASENVLQAIEASIVKIKQQSEGAVVAIEVASHQHPDSVKDSCFCEHRFGSGFVFAPDGIIVTTDGLVNTAQEITVIRQNGETFPAEVVGRDFETNLAVLKIKAANLPVLPLSDMAVPSGCLGIMVGNTSYSQGLACSWGLVNHTWIGGDDCLDQKLLVIQAQSTEVESGVPVLDVGGRLIGIAEGHLENNDALWTVIPVTTIKPVIEKLMDSGSIARGWVGIKSSQACPQEELVQLMHQWQGKGAVVSSIVPGSPAEQAGIEVGDIVVKLNSKPISCISDFRRQVTALPPGNRINMEIIRNNQNITMDVTLASIPADLQRKRRCSSRSA